VRRVVESTFPAESIRAITLALLADAELAIEDPPVEAYPVATIYRPSPEREIKPSEEAVPEATMPKLID
jgi:hypothetical protein